MLQKYFPQGVATDTAFCNREIERVNLKSSIEIHEHTVLVAPRRYGKTSLLTKVLKENHFLGTIIDLFFALTQEDVQKIISEGISQIITQLLPKSTLSRQKLIKAIASHNPKLTFNFLGQKLEISAKQKAEKSLSEVLLALDQFAAKAKKSCVVVFDEFQQIGELKGNHAIEAAIRHAVERSEHISYIFCGSNRHLLDKMFSSKSRPLYHLCDLMIINRISDQCYKKFINKMSKKRWKIILNSDVIDEIVYLTENHPYYVNALCRRLWRSDKAPAMGDVKKTWDTYVVQQHNWIINDLSHLSLNRRKVVTALAYQPTNEPQGQVFSGRSGLNPSSIKKCLVDLEKLDMVYQTSQGFYKVLDPVIAYYIRQFS